MLEIASDELRAIIAPERGGQFCFVGRPDGGNVLSHYEWKSPVRDARSRSYGTSQLDFLADYRGGWQELFPNPGAECVVLGIPLPFHGDVAGAAWTVVESTRASAVIRTATRLPLVLERRMTVHGPTLHLRERVLNDAAVSAPFAWGHHPALAAAPGSTIDMPPGPVVADSGVDSPLVDVRPGSSGEWPNVPSKNGRIVDLSVVPEGPVERFCYRPNLGIGWAALRDHATGSGVALSWDSDAFPHAWFWQSICSPSFPSYGRARITAIEPTSVWPADGLAAAIERGQARLVEPGGEATAWLTMTLLDRADRPIVAVSPRGAVSFGSGA